MCACTQKTAGQLQMLTPGIGNPGVVQTWEENIADLQFIVKDVRLHKCIMHCTPFHPNPHLNMNGLLYT